MVQQVGVCGSGGTINGIQAHVHVNESVMRLI